MKRLCFLITIILISRPIYAQLYINEFMASNNQTIADEFGEFDDWIEIYNYYDHSVNLSGFYLTENFENPTKWAFPAISIAAKSYLLIWADDMTEQGELHTNFKLSAEGEQIGLYDGASFVDSLTFGQQMTDISYGRYPDGGTNWVSFSKPSPNAANNGSIIEFAKVPNFSSQGGFYYEPVTVELSVASPNATIYYTLDCYEPTKKSLLYTGPILINKTTVIRARTYEDGILPSKIITNTYIFNMDFDIAMLSLVTNPPNLWDPNYGIYVNPNEDGDQWERPASFEFYEANNSPGFVEDIGIRIHGKTAQNYDKKPFRFYFRSEYGSSWLEYPLFISKANVTEFKRFVLHSGATDMPANPFGYGWTLLRDPLMYELGRRTNALYAANKYVAVYLNGTQWGIYYLEERIDQYYTESNFGESDVDLIENYKIAREGDLVEWDYMRSFFADHDLSKDVNYETAKSLVDIDNVTNYNIVEIFGGNGDWPSNNQLAYRARIVGALWKWILWDMDGSFGPYGVLHNTLEWATREDNESTLILRTLLNNTTYRNLFINRFADLLNTTFLTSNVKALIDSLSAVIRNDITFETGKWGSSPAEWEQNGIKGELYNFAKYRPDEVRDHIKEKFSLSGTVNLTIEPPQNGYGKIKVNSIYIAEYPWNGIYFKKIPLPLAAIPNPGYHFLGWSDPSLPQTEDIIITLNNDYTIHAIFESDASVAVVINEINYNSDGDFNPEDWIELYNSSEEPVNVSGWHVKDDDAAHDFIFPPGAILSAKGYLVVCRDQILFHELSPEVTNYIGNLDFGLDSDGDQVRLFSPSLLLIDSVSYDNEPPWPVDPDGNGSTLELINSDEDNTLPANWQASVGHGTPGRLNSIPIVITEINYNSAIDFNPEDWVELYNPSNRTVDLSGWHFKDDDNTQDYTFPAATNIGPYGFLILCYNQAAFQNLFPDVTNTVGDFDFGLSGGGDDVKIYDAFFNLVDSVSYDDDLPWPIEADGKGPTLELLAPALDNIKPKHWQASLAHGSPGQLTFALPVVNSFMVTDSSGATDVTDSRDILITMTVSDYDGNVIKWHVNEDSVAPSPSDFILTSRPTSYHIQGAEGNVIIYGWALDNDNQVSRLANTSQDTIRLALNQQRFVIAGTVNYDSKAQSVSDVIITATDSQGNSSDTTAANGNYAFSALEPGEVTLSPHQPNHNQDAIGGSDALLVLQYLAFLVNMSDDNKLAADVTDDGNVTGSDVLAILRYLAFYPDNIGSTGQWRFQPHDTSFTLNADLTIDFKAYVLGDANLSWIPSGPPMAKASSSANIALTIAPVDASWGESIEIPIGVITPDETINTLQFSVAYDAEWLRFESVKPTAVTEKFLIQANGSETGTVHVAMAGIEGIKSTTEILRFKFKVIAPSKHLPSTRLTLVRALANDRILNTTSDDEVRFSEVTPEIIPEDFALFHNYPNPFNADTQIEFHLPQSAHVSIKIYNLRGSEIRTILSEDKAAGSYRVTWDGKDNHGTALPSGIYMLQLQSEGFVQSQKMIMMK